MMTRQTLIIISAACVLALGASAASAQVDSVWTRTYGGVNNDGFRSVIPTSDGGYLAVGYTYSYGEDDANMFVVKTDAYGNAVWQRAYGGAGRDYAFSACEVAGEFVVVGYTTSFGSGKEDVYVVRIDADGDTVWTRAYGGSAPDEARAVCAAGSDVVVAGRTESFGAGGGDLYVLKVDDAGDTVWARTYGGAECDWGQSVCETVDGYYAVGGTTGSNTANRDIVVVKIDPDGLAAWQKYFGLTGSVSPDWGMAVCASPDSGVTLAGYQAAEGTDPGDAVILGVDKAGTQVYYRKYGSDYYQYGCGICATHDGGFVICGCNKNPDTQKNDLLVLKRIPGSGWQWAEIVGGDLSDWGSSVIQTQAGCFLVAGHTASFGSGGFDGWLVKLCDATASVGDRGEEDGGTLDLVPDPNPFGGGTQIRFRVPTAGHVTLAIYDVSGRCVALLYDGPGAAGEFTSAWNGRDLSGREVGPGIYLARVVAGGISETQKLILLR
jgi:hypothetical protein